MCSGVGGHNRHFAFFVWELLIWSVVLVGTLGNFCIFALLHFFLESFDLVGGVGGHNGQEVRRDGVKIAASQPPLVYSM